MLIGHLHIFLREMSTIWVVCLFVLSYKRFLKYILDTRPLFDLISKYLLPICRLSLHFPIGSFDAQDFLTLIKSVIYFFILSFVLLVWYLRKHRLIQSDKKIYPYVSSSEFYSFSLLDIGPWFILHCVHCEIGVQMFPFAKWISTCSSTICWKEHLLKTLIDWTWHFVKNHLTINVLLYFWTLELYSVDLECLSLCQFHTILMTIAL